MDRKIIRITTPEKALEDTLAKQDSSLLLEWLDINTEDLEYRLRYTKTEETQLIQGALRAFDDLREVLR